MNPRGKRLPEIPICSSCGAKLNQMWAYCPHCSSPVYGTHIQSPNTTKCDGTTYLEDTLLSLGLIGSIKAGLPLKDRGLIDYLDLHVVFEHGKFSFIPAENRSARLVAGDSNNAVRAFDVKHIRAEPDFWPPKKIWPIPLLAGEWKIQKFDKHQWNRRFAKLVEPTCKLAIYVKKAGDLSEEEVEALTKDIGHFHSTGKWHSFPITSISSAELLKHKSRVGISFRGLLHYFSSEEIAETLLTFGKEIPSTNANLISNLINLANSAEPLTQATSQLDTTNHYFPEAVRTETILTAFQEGPLARVCVAMGLPSASPSSIDVTNVVNTLKKMDQLETIPNKLWFAHRLNRMLLTVRRTIYQGR